jgi:sulfite reductase alpha subunit-like flavoprotein
MVKLEGGIGSPFDETPVPFLELLNSPHRDSNGTLILMFVSTTGDGEQCDSIRNTWKSLLQKSLPKNMLAGSKHEFALFCLGDRAYGPQFCAAGRKLAVRLLQLGMPSFCEVGYGDDNTPNGGVFRDLDDWLEGILLPQVLESSSPLPPVLTDKNGESSISKPSTSSCPYRVQITMGEIESDLNGDIFNDNDDERSTQDQDEKKEESKAAEWEVEFLDDSYRDYFMERGPATAYSYGYSRGERITTAADISKKTMKSTPLVGNVVINERITDSDWEQNTRHIKIELMQSESQSKGTQDHGTGDETFDACNNVPEENGPPLPYMAGDVASVLPFNSRAKVNQFLSVLPDSLSSLADSVIRIDLNESYATDNRYTRWPRRCTFRGWLTYCADIQSLPEREDVRALSAYCAPRNDELNEDSSLNQSEKLRSFSETSGAALYADYILREKRSWIDVLHDFESLQEPGSRLTLEALLMILPPMRTRDFSIASAPSMGMILNKSKGNGSNRTSRFDTDHLMKLFSIELCVAVVEGTTRLGRSYHGQCSKFLSQLSPVRSAITATDGQFCSEYPSQLFIWIRPGTFGKMPMQLRCVSPSSFEVPIICVGAGTGIAPMRSLILERAAVRFLARKREEEDYITDDSKTKIEDMSVKSASSIDENENILIFGCRKQNADYYYKNEWEMLRQENNIRLLTAFSQDQLQKMYVQKILRDADDGALIAKHILERGGAIFIAGNPKMARAVKEEITEVLSDALPGGEKQANKLLNKMQRMGRFSIEAWN